MLEILKFVFSSFWVWAGTVVLVTVPLSLLCVALTSLGPSVVTHNHVSGKDPRCP